MAEESAGRAARTPGAKRAGPGEYVFDLASVNHILGGPDYSTANGSCVERDRMIVGLVRMPAGTGAAPPAARRSKQSRVRCFTYRPMSCIRARRVTMATWCSSP